MIALLPVGVIATACSMFIATLAPQPDGEGMDQSLSIGLGLLGFVIFNPLTPLALFFLITGPIVAAGVRPGPAIAPWVLLRGRLDATCAVPVAPTRAMLIGLVWGSTVLVLWRHAGLGAFFGGSGTEVLVLYAALLAGAAAVAAAASPAWRFEHGLLALVAAALPSALAFEGMAPVAALGFAWTLVTVGFVFAAPLATLGAALGDLRRRSGAAARGAFRVGS
jgi:hypothetical protein